MNEKDLRKQADVRILSETEYDSDPSRADQLTRQGFRVAVLGDTDRSVQMILGARTAFNADD